MLQSELVSRNIPDVLKMNDGTIVTDLGKWQTRRHEIMDILNKNMYGYSPRFESKTTGVVVRTDNESYGGKAITYDIDIQIKSPFSYFSFPCSLSVPKETNKPKVFLYYSFTPTIGDGIGEEILDNGYALLNVYYQDIAPDKDDKFFSGLGRFASRNKYDSWGKIAMWAWAGTCIMDYLQTLQYIDSERIAVMGHSRLGKTALLCGAIDERFSLTVSNNSGAGGAALFRGKTGEKIKDLAGKGSSFWFCGNFFDYINKEEELPFDQHFVLSLIAPRNIYVSSATEDDWADPKSEFLACLAVNPVYNLHNMQGIVSNEETLDNIDYLHDGKVAYHLRKGSHYLSRYDWNKIIEYRNRHNV